MTLSDDKKLDYAWDWLKYHAQQRMTAFNYFLILIGIIVVGYTKCVEMVGKSQPNMEQAGMAEIWWFIALAISICGIIISIAFYFLDIRNLELVNCGRKTLDEIENTSNLHVRKDDLDRIGLKESLDIISEKLSESTLKKVVKHSFWLRTIMIASTLLWIFGGIFAIIQLLNIHDC